jgi:hypothetical protein
MLQYALAFTLLPASEGLYVVMDLALYIEPRNRMIKAKASAVIKDTFIPTSIPPLETNGEL